MPPPRITGLHDNKLGLNCLGWVHCLTGSLILHFKLPGKRCSHFSVLRKWAAKSSGTSSSFGRQVVLANNYIIMPHLVLHSWETLIVIISHLVLHSKNIIITNQHYNNKSICVHYSSTGKYSDLYFQLPFTFHSNKLLFHAINAVRQDFRPLLHKLTKL